MLVGVGGSCCDRRHRHADSTWIPRRAARLPAGMPPCPQHRRPVNGIVPDGASAACYMRRASSIDGKGAVCTEDFSGIAPRWVIAFVAALAGRIAMLVVAPLRHRRWPGSRRRGHCIGVGQLRVGQLDDQYRCGTRWNADLGEWPERRLGAAPQSRRSRLDVDDGCSEVVVARTRAGGVRRRVLGCLGGAAAQGDPGPGGRRRVRWRGDWRSDAFSGP
jgi:hypothetical protein